ncbi:hypothetical protein IEQ34_020756 [Dendrobium chrysotoxum]|uniref:Uncharacterized protein n=1 Tax=Dendrobium chrysotoxum TaxID=161865 RepID=A0AAV7G382_DENCH|nr:hypothetical protein IEQ34_020756 [Dendrobium chrysotoxum]
MLQFPAFMRQFPSPPLIASSTLLPLLASSHNDELLLAMEESELEDRWNEIRKANINLPVIGKAGHDYKEDIDADAEDDDADNLEESDGDEFEQETGLTVFSINTPSFKLCIFPTISLANFTYDLIKLKETS